MNYTKLNLRLFDANPNTTETIPQEVKTYYSDYLIDNAKPNLVHCQFGQKYTIPKNGGKTINFRRFVPFSPSTEQLVEGVTPNGGTLSVTDVTATIGEYGYYVTLTDMLTLTSIDNTILETTKLLGNQAGHSIDSITREVLCGGTSVMYCGSVNSRESIDEQCTMRVKDIFYATRFLKSQNAPKIDGYYIGIIHPDVAFDIMQDPEWIEASKYAGSVQLFEGEIGKIAGVRFVETTEAKKLQTEAADVYCTLILGANAYGVTELEGGGIKTIIKQLGSAGSADPLNQRATVGWKAFHTAERLVENYMVRLESASGYSYY